MSLATDEILDTVLFGIPALYGFVLGQPQPHSWIGATILAMFRATVAVSLILVFYHAIQVRRTYVSLIRRVVRGSSEEASCDPSQDRMADRQTADQRDTPSSCVRRILPNAIRSQDTAAPGNVRFLSSKDSGVCPARDGEC